MYPLFAVSLSVLSCQNCSSTKRRSLKYWAGRCVVASNASSWWLKLMIPWANIYWQPALPYIAAPKYGAHRVGCLAWGLWTQLQSASKPATAALISSTGENTGKSCVLCTSPLKRHMRTSTFKVSSRVFFSCRVATTCGGCWLK